MTAGDNATPAPLPPTSNDEKDRRDGQGPALGPDGGDAGHVQAAPLIKQFGGIRPMATKLGVPVSTVQGWKQRGAIPVARLSEIEAAATANGIVLDAAPAAESGDEAVVVSESPESAINPDPGRAPLAVAAPPPKQRRRGGAAIGLSVVALLASLGAAGGVLWLNSNNTGEVRQTRALLQRVEALEAEAAVASGLTDRLAALESEGGAADELAAAIAGLEVDLAAVEADLADEIETLRAATTGRPVDVPGATARLNALGARLAALEQGGSGGEESRLGSVQDRLDAVEGSLIGLSETQSSFVAQLSTAATADALMVAMARIAVLEGGGEDLAALLDEFAGIEARLVAITAADVVEPRALALVLALQQMRLAVAAGKPFAAELDVAQRLAGRDNPLAGPLATLEAEAASGLATADQLRAGFPNVARMLLQASLSADASASLADRLRARVAGVVSVRRTDVGGEDDSNDIDRALARADVALAADDLAGVVTALAAHEDGAPAEVAGWLAAARARVAADEVIAQVDTAAFAILSRAERE